MSMGKIIEFPDDKKLRETLEKLRGAAIRKG